MVSDKTDTMMYHNLPQPPQPPHPHGKTNHNSLIQNTSDYSNKEDARVISSAADWGAIPPPPAEVGVSLQYLDDDENILGGACGE